jgi:diacylglycerol kinase family enzyme
MTNIKILINPAAGNGQGLRLLRTKLPFPIAATCPNNIDQQLIDFIKPGDTLIIGGGDGTFHLVFNGLYRTQLYQQIQIALLPMGTGNDLARALAYPKLSLATLIQRLQGATQCVSLPLWKYGDIVFSNYLSFGMDADILNDVSQWRCGAFKRRWFTKLLYILAGLKHIIHPKKIIVQLQHERQALLCLILANLNIYGGGCHVRTMSNSTTLALLAIETRWQFIRLMLTRFTRQPYYAKNILSPIELDTGNVLAEADGEILANHAVHITYAGALTIVK